MKIAFLGTGNMGEPMARNLLRAGHEVAVWNRTRARSEPLVKDGARLAAAVADAARGAEIAVSMLANDQAVREVVHGGLLEAMDRGAIHIGSSTVSVELGRELAREHAAAGQGYVSAPVLGRPDSAEGRKLWIIAAGPPGLVERCRPLFDALGRGVTVIGADPWQANLVKIGANFTIASMIETFGEAFALVRKAGIEPHQFLEVVNSLFNSPVYANYGRIIADGKFEPAGFRMRLGLKDINLALAAADAEAVPMPLAGLIHDRFLEGVARGWADRDWSAVAEVSAVNAGVERSRSA